MTRGAHGAHQPSGLVWRFLPILDLDVGQQESVGAVFVKRRSMRSSSPAQVVEQRGLIVLGPGRGFQLGQRECPVRPADCTSLASLSYFVCWRNRSRPRWLGQYPQQTGAKVRKSFHFSSENDVRDVRKPLAAPTARYQPKLTPALPLRTKAGRQGGLRKQKG